MAHSRVAAAGEVGDASGCITTTYVPDGSMSDAEYDTYYDAQGFPKPGNLLNSLTDQGASVVVDIDL